MIPQLSVVIPSCTANEFSEGRLDQCGKHGGEIRQTFHLTHWGLSMTVSGVVFIIRQSLHYSNLK